MQGCFLFKDPARQCLNQTCSWISLAFVISLRLICFRPFIFPTFHGRKSIGEGESLPRNRSFTISSRLDVFFRLLRFRFQGKNFVKPDENRVDCKLVILKIVSLNETFYKVKWYQNWNLSTLLKLWFMSQKITENISNKIAVFDVYTTN